jgi:hypothetical protein
MTKALQLIHIESTIHFTNVKGELQNYFPPLTVISNCTNVSNRAVRVILSDGIFTVIHYSRMTHSREITVFILHADQRFGCNACHDIFNTGTLFYSQLDQNKVFGEKGMRCFKEIQAKEDIARCAD